MNNRKEVYETRLKVVCVYQSLSRSYIWVDKKLTICVRTSREEFDCALNVFEEKHWAKSWIAWMDSLSS